MSIVNPWSPLFQSQVRMHGRAYQSAGQVKRVEPLDDELLRAQVHGTQLYSVTIRQEHGGAVADCTCSTFEGGAYCKHIWATLLDLQEGGDAPGVSADQLADLKVRAPRARKRDQTAGPSRTGEPSWIGRLSLLRPPAADLDQPLSPQRQVCYVVLPQRSTRHAGPVIEVRQRTPGAKGWSRLKQLKIGSETLAGLTDPGDLELCALLLGAACVDDEEPAGSFRTERAHGAYRLPKGARRMLLRQMIATGRCFVDLAEDTGGNEVALRWDDDKPWVLWAVVTEEADGLLVNAELRRGDRRMPVGVPDLVVGGPDGLVIWEGKAAPFDDRDALRWVNQFRDPYGYGKLPSPIHVPKADADRFLERLYMLPQLPEIDLPLGLSRTAQRVKPVPHLDLFGPESPDAKPWLSGSVKNQLVAKLWFAYAQQRVGALQPGRFISIDTPQDEEGAAEPAVPTEARLIRRDSPNERRALAVLGGLGFRAVADSSPGPDWTGLIPLKRMPMAVAELIAQGWVVFAEQRVVRKPGSPSLSVASGMDWFELHGTIRYPQDDGAEQQVPLPQILAAARSGRKMIQLEDGSQGLLPDKWLQTHGMLTTLGRVKNDHLRYKLSQAAMLDALLDAAELVRVDQTFSLARQRLHEFDGLGPLHEATQFHGALRPYQRDGLGWAAFLRWFGAGGVLADDMGLGKTIQVLAMLQARYAGVPEHCDSPTPASTAPPDNAPQAPRSLGQSASRAANHLPSLVAAPRSVVFNWMDEALRFTPDLRTMAYTGANRQDLRDTFQDYDLIVTSYGLLRRDIAELRSHRFDYVVLDEAQAIKNPASQSAKAARLLEARHRLALSGTPVENHLGDLWSIFEFLNPGMLGSNARFADLLRSSSAGRVGNVGPAVDSAGTEDSASSGGTANGGADSSRAQALGQIAATLRPFILRRTKKQVLDDLPEKTEQTIVCEMEAPQRKLYNELRQYYRGQLLSQFDGGPAGEGGRSPQAGGSSFIVLEALLRLRQVACHPGLIDSKRQSLGSAKLDALLEMLADVIEEGAKALVFSQFTAMLALVRDKLDQQAIRYTYLDGKTRDRRKVVQQFQTDPQVSVFLISLKAGGFGLNLTAAEYVFILDPWWNPAVEAQAIDRTHRIGQTRRVFAYRLICKDSVEQRIIELQNHKRKLAEAIVGDEQNLVRSLTRQDLERLLS